MHLYRQERRTAQVPSTGKSATFVLAMRLAGDHKGGSIHPGIPLSRKNVIAPA
jgi:hypothetical protein